MRSRKLPPKRLNKAQRAGLLELIERINGERITSRDGAAEFLETEGLPAWLLDWSIWSAGENMPGYLPDTPYTLFATERAARGYCRELEREGARAAGYETDYLPVTIREVL